MDVWNSGGRQMARTFDELVRLRACLRPRSVEEIPSFQPFEEIALPDETPLHLTPNVEEVLGWTAAYLKSIYPAISLLLPGDIDTSYPNWYHALMGRKVRGDEIRFAHADGTGYVWLVSDLRPRLRYPDGRVRDVHIRTFDITTLRARELNFAISCLRQFHPRRDRDILEDLDIPSLINKLLPHRHNGNGGTVLQFSKSNGTRRPRSHRIRRLQPDISHQNR
ncbi:MAG: hypothetical protein V3U86_12335 [Acidobacteriota bacterium]